MSPDVTQIGMSNLTVIPGVEHRAVDRRGDIVGVEEHLAVVVVVDGRTEPVPDLAVGLRSRVDGQHLSVVEGTAPPPAERFIPFFHREERLVGRCRLLAAREIAGDAHCHIDEPRPCRRNPGERRWIMRPRKAGCVDSIPNR